MGRRDPRQDEVRGGYGLCVPLEQSQAEVVVAKLLVADGQQDVDPELRVFWHQRPAPAEEALRPIPLMLLDEQPRFEKHQGRMIGGALRPGVVERLLERGERVGGELHGRHKRQKPRFIGILREPLGEELEGLALRAMALEVRQGGEEDSLVVGKLCPRCQEGGGGGGRTATTGLDLGVGEDRRRIRRIDLRRASGRSTGRRHVLGRGLHPGVRQQHLDTVRMELVGPLEHDIGRCRGAEPLAEEVGQKEKGLGVGGRRSSGCLGCPGLSERLLSEIEADESGEDRGSPIEVTTLRPALREEEIDGSGLVGRCPTFDCLTDDEEVLAGLDRIPRGEFEFAEPASQFDTLGALPHRHLGSVEGRRHIIATRPGAGGPAKEQEGIRLEGIGVRSRPGGIEVGPVKLDRPVVVPIDGCLPRCVEFGGCVGGHPGRPPTNNHRHGQSEGAEAGDEEDRGQVTLHGENTLAPVNRTLTRPGAGCAR